MIATNIIKGTVKTSDFQTYLWTRGKELVLEQQQQLHLQQKSNE